MSDTQSTDIDRTGIRTHVRETVRAADDPPTRADLVETVATLAGVPTDAVDAELDALEREGFVYLVGDGDDAEVKLP